MLKIKYEGKGWYMIISKNNRYWCFPKEAYCSCPSNKVECKHLKEIYARLKDKGIGIENLWREK
jgi:hypothetical protein